MKKILLSSAIILIVTCAGFAAWTFIFNKESASDIFSEAFSDTLTTEDIYLSYEIQSNNISMSGEATGDLTSDNVELKAELDVEAEFDGIPANMSAELISIGEGKDKTSTYLRFVDVSSDDPVYGTAFADYFAPAINKWVFSDEPNEDSDASFKKDGPTAGLDVVSIFVPLSGLGEDDQAKYLELVDKYNFYQVDDEITEIDFRGVDARKLKVTINKDSLKEIENELESSLSDDADFEPFTDKFIKQLFGSKETISADVLVRADSNEFLGIDLMIKLDEAVTEEEFNVTFDEVDVSVLIEKDRDANIEAPTEFLTEEEFNKLFES